MPTAPWLRSVDRTEEDRTLPEIGKAGNKKGSTRIPNSRPRYHRILPTEAPRNWVLLQKRRWMRKERRRIFIRNSKNRIQKKKKIRATESRSPRPPLLHDRRSPRKLVMVQKWRLKA
ncbi:hypothetical protein H6P81_018394 [Aristolochia fimbriata]|uniref:Uncharacterized protein n=1 Tax=Aristolochia fimbriata TaxID=158543 RepID=A0AAV7E305_ARIFI|nr:hypothetical protein H6P81_018394 [Aristolochia fimbriata]